MKDNEKVMMDTYHVYPHNPRLTVEAQAERYAQIKYGRGPSHVRAYREGARFLARLLKEGKLALEDIINPNTCI